MAKKIKVVLTMDCEPTKETSHPLATGPEDWAGGRIAVEGYAEIGRNHGFPTTFFVHPETAVGQPEVFKELQAKGACLGLHMHPWKYSTWKHGSKKYMAHYGGLTVSEQRELLAEAAARWADAIGYQPRYFRPGTFSGNDSIFQVLSELGFLGGSCSAPGRVMPEMQAVWYGAEPDPHRTHGQFRHIKGDLPFVNMPLSADFSRILDGKVGRKMHPDFRPDVDWLDQYGVDAPSIAQNIVQQVIARDPDVPVVNFISHNQYDYQDPADATRRRFEGLLEALHDAAKAAGVELVGATLADVVKDVMELPIVKEPLVLEGAVFDADRSRAEAR